MIKFKVGDMAKCVDANFRRVTIGRYYEVVGAWYGGVNVRDDKGTVRSYYNHRFERVDKMSSEKLEAQIEQNETDQEKLQKEGERLKGLLADSQVTYSIGNRFRLRGRKYILASANTGDEVQLTNLQGGTRWVPPCAVENYHRITQAEFSRVTEGDPLNRYWDSQRKVKT